ncbi:JAB domain-containing protein [Variovorax sp. J2P1-59]|uniref:JAB domain-containing protein n=1 Tax=Variovorax flavidus TaxID=3053501 RepID=UPI0025757469|nr:JAB domain-containing protein [Variovorax sp. J2P1-59]MDM0078045.1 JAB domain-containing protein [Variovorax sp. J2P1-59]
MQIDTIQRNNEAGGVMAYLRQPKVTFVRTRADEDLLNRAVEKPRQVYDLFKDMQDESKEKVVVLHLNSQLEVLSYEVASMGVAHQAVFDPFEIYRNAMLARASSLVVVHNHPSGTCKPSNADVAVALRMSELGKLHDMILQDFIIIGFGEFYSFRDHGQF